MTATLGTFEHFCSNSRYCDGEVLSASESSVSRMRKHTLSIDGRIIKVFTSPESAREWAKDHGIEVIGE